MGNRDINLLTENTREKRLSLKERVLNEYGYDIFITDGFRTAEDQNKLYQRGRTASGSIITYVDGYKQKSSHQFGIAFDIAFKGSQLYPGDHKVRENVAIVARGIGLEWGYDLWKRDRPHFQNTWDKPLMKEYPPESEILVEKGIWNGNLGFTEERRLTLLGKLYKSLQK